MLSDLNGVSVGVEGCKGVGTFSLSPSYEQFRADWKLSFARRELKLHFTDKGLSGTVDPGGLEKVDGPSVMSAQSNGAKVPVKRARSRKRLGL